MCPGDERWQLHTWREHTHPPFDETWGHRFSPTVEPVERDAHGTPLISDELMERVGRHSTWTKTCDMPPG